MSVIRSKRCTTRDKPKARRLNLGRRCNRAKKGGRSWRSIRRTPVFWLILFDMKQPSCARAPPFTLAVHSRARHKASTDLHACITNRTFFLERLIAYSVSRRAPVAEPNCSLHERLTPKPQSRSQHAYTADRCARIPRGTDSEQTECLDFPSSDHLQGERRRGPS